MPLTAGATTKVRGQWGFSHNPADEQRRSAQSIHRARYARRLQLDGVWGIGIGAWNFSVTVGPSTAPSESPPVESRVLIAAPQVVAVARPLKSRRRAPFAPDLEVVNRHPHPPGLACLIACHGQNTHLRLWANGVRTGPDGRCMCVDCSQYGDRLAGDSTKLKMTVNSMVAQLNTLANEVTRVSFEVGTEDIRGGQVTVPAGAGHVEVSPILSPFDTLDVHPPLSPLSSDKQVVNLSPALQNLGAHAIWTRPELRYKGSASLAKLYRVRIVPTSLRHSRHPTNTVRARLAQKSVCSPHDCFAIIPAVPTIPNSASTFSAQRRHRQLANSPQTDQTPTTTNDDDVLWQSDEPMRSSLLPTDLKPAGTVSAHPKPRARWARAPTTSKNASTVLTLAASSTLDPVQRKRVYQFQLELDGVRPAYLDVLRSGIGGDSNKKMVQYLRRDLHTDLSVAVLSAARGKTASVAMYALADMLPVEMPSGTDSDWEERDVSDREVKSRRSVEKWAILPFRIWRFHRHNFEDTWACLRLPIARIASLNLIFFRLRDSDVGRRKVTAQKSRV
ncbi:hypothetical protein DFP72DRAFT_850573 [Ephemerocybe angulata]|uniref:Uncharacterized protein n=1 Tax=Ephemerocybe angulata TaxID=980116 RepID=A0A8H6HRB3_9AGAR|nr:hypothetical protein DFP72DRAFT_850573 [Tulosesus angulatus]